VGNSITFAEQLLSINFRNVYLSDYACIDTSSFNPDLGVGSFALASAGHDRQASLGLSALGWGALRLDALGLLKLPGMIV
jgi:hypothetical protein